MAKKSKKDRALTRKINEKMFPMLSAKGINSIYALSRSIDENAGSISKIKRGLSDWTIEQLDKISRIHGISIDSVFGKENSSRVDAYGKAIRARKVPILGYAECGSSTANWMDFASRIVELTDVTGMVNPFILVAKGDSMRPYINPGDKLLCSEIQHKIKDNIAVVAVFKSPPDTFEANAKLINWDRRNKLITLYSINTKYAPTNHSENEFVKIYKVNRIIRDVK
ncbi:MAG: S24 family peptidase [Ignavibacteria bacterium]|nr:S24 family peptidase [Ignavibacteria bacterium]